MATLHFAGRVTDRLQVIPDDAEPRLLAVRRRDRDGAADTTTLDSGDVREATGSNRSSTVARGASANAYGGRTRPGGSQDDACKGSPCVGELPRLSPPRRATHHGQPLFNHYKTLALEQSRAQLNHTQPSGANNRDPSDVPSSSK